MRKILILFYLALFIFFFLELSFAQMSSSEIEAIQKAIQERGLSWTAGVNEITKITEAEREGMLGGLPPEPGSPERPREGIDKWAKLPMPAYFSWGNYSGHNWMSSIKNQGSCGSCWGFAAGGAFEANEKIFVNQYNFPIDCSEQYMVSCWRQPGQGCTAWWLDSTLAYLSTPGAPDESCFPYVSGDGNPRTCTGYCSDYLSRLCIVGAWGRYDWPGVAKMKNEIQYYGPLMTRIEIYDDFYSYSGGVYVHTSGSDRGGHFVVFYGWDDANNCWLAKNSWGTGWGETGPDGTRGWFRIRMGYNEIDCEHWVYWLEPRYVYRGDANYDLIKDIGDIVYLINYVFYGGPKPIPFEAIGDCNCDLVIDIGDIVLLINYVFYGGLVPNC